MAAEVRRQVGRRLGVRRGHARRRRGRGAVEVDRVVVAGPGEQRPVVGPGPPAGDPGEGAGTLPGLGVPALAQGGVRPGDGGPRDTEPLGELALAGQPDVEADPAVADQQAERLGEAGVRRVAVEPVDEGGGPGRADGLRHAGHCLTIGYLGEGQLARHWTGDRDRHAHRGTPADPARPGSGGAAASGPAAAAAGPAVRRPAGVRRVVGADGARRPRPGALGRAALGLHRARADHPRPGRHPVQLRGAGVLDPAPGEAGHRHHLQRAGRRPQRRRHPGPVRQPGRDRRRGSP